MMDISKESVKIECPDCKKSISVTLNQVAQEVMVNCICGQEIQLKDSKGTSKKAIEDVNKSLKDLEKAIKKLGK
jgi:hypothetical protein